MRLRTSLANPEQFGRTSQHPSGTSEDLKQPPKRRAVLTDVEKTIYSVSIRDDRGTKQRSTVPVRLGFNSPPVTGVYCQPLQREVQPTSIEPSVKVALVRQQRNFVGKVLGYVFCVMHEAMVQTSPCHRS